MDSAAPTRLVTPSLESGLNPASDINARLDTQLEVKVYPCNNSNSAQRKKVTTFLVKPEGILIQGTNSAAQNNRNHHRSNNPNEFDLGAEYARHIGRKLPHYELADTRATQLLVTSHNKSFWVVPSPNEEAFSRHSGTCRLLGDRKHQPTNHTLQVGDFLRVGSVGVVVIEIHDGKNCTALSEEKIQRIMKEATTSPGFVVDMEDTDLEYASDDASDKSKQGKEADAEQAMTSSRDVPCCYMCFDETETDMNPLITPCKCLGDTRYVHVECLRKWHSAESDNKICFLSKVDATCSVCKSTFQSNIKLKNGRVFKLFKSCLEPPYVSLLVATKHEMAQKLFNTRFQLSFSTLLRPDLQNGLRPLILGRSSASDMVLDYRTVSARHAQIRFKNGEFIFQDAGSSNGSYLYLRQPVELTPNATQSIQFRIGRSMVAMKVVSKWNRRLLRAVRGRGSNSGANHSGGNFNGNYIAIGNDEDYQYTIDGMSTPSSPLHPKLTSHEQVMKSLPPIGKMSQTSDAHLELLFALAYPRPVSLHSSPTKFIPRSLNTSPIDVNVNRSVSRTPAAALSPESLATAATAADVHGAAQVDEVTERMAVLNVNNIISVNEKDDEEDNVVQSNASDEGNDKEVINDNCIDCDEEDEEEKVDLEESEHNSELPVQTVVEPEEDAEKDQSQVVDEALENEEMYEVDVGQNAEEALAVTEVNRPAINEDSSTQP